VIAFTIYARQYTARTENSVAALIYVLAGRKVAGRAL